MCYLSILLHNYFESINLQLLIPTLHIPRIYPADNSWQNKSWDFLPTCYCSSLQMSLYPHSSYFNAAGPLYVIKTEINFRNLMWDFQFLYFLTSWTFLLSQNSDTRVHTHMHAHTRIRTHTCKHARTHTCEHACTHTHMRARTHAHTSSQSIFSLSHLRRLVSIPVIRSSLLGQSKHSVGCYLITLNPHQVTPLFPYFIISTSSLSLLIFHPLWQPDAFFLSSFLFCPLSSFLPTPVFNPL